MSMCKKNSKGFVGGFPDLFFSDVNANKYAQTHRKKQYCETCWTPADLHLFLVSFLRLLRSVNGFDLHVFLAPAGVSLWANRCVVMKYSSGHFRSCSLLVLQHPTKMRKPISCIFARHMHNKSTI